MLVNADFTKKIFLTPDEYQWVPSPQEGIERIMLDRVGDERARATSIVRYANSSYFPQHTHPGGEEIFVLSGILSEEHGHYPEGWYIRNPPGSTHQPFSIEGAVIFVKLWQMQSGDQRYVRVNTRDPSNWQRDGNRDICLLFDNEREHVMLVCIEANSKLLKNPIEGFEILVLNGELLDEVRRYVRGSWIRVPAGEAASLLTGNNGATIYLKTSHLTKKT
ncbi:anti-sigma factor [Pseudomonas atacamensis]|uniref:Anti-sigma factor n=1 Tax=Pseudomonas atacamensis TaxID=2565368 RepID=A0AAQ2D6A7_9PSED|nr:cupin domain-containing protein [Pseudomonas atacamensis]THF25791.1 anti-sigma factor [Pseudomonas atacamensis]